ncbi:MAG: hypothetical protein IJ147_10775 [Lachnospiraceae bacterium]|nr:hypothetical protein [Lachnospiraceae bacterium]
MTEKKEFIKCWIKRIQFKHRLRRMDRRWRMQGGASYDLFPPSFYYTHSAQEIKEITDREISCLREMIRKYEEENAQK